MEKKITDRRKIRNPLTQKKIELAEKLLQDDSYLSISKVNELIRNEFNAGLNVQTIANIKKGKRFEFAKNGEEASPLSEKLSEKKMEKTNPIDILKMPPLPRRERYLTLGQMAYFCQLNRLTVQKWILKGEMKGYTLPSGHFRVKDTDFIAFLNRFKMPVPEELTGSSRARVLVAEDEHITAKFYKTVLEEAGFEVTIATNGIDTCIKLGYILPDLLVLDILMPGITGVEVCEAILNHPFLAFMKILVVTGMEEPEIIQSINNLGVSDILRKPVSGELLLHRVDQILKVDEEPVRKA